MCMHWYVLVSDHTVGVAVVIPFGELLQGVWWLGVAQPDFESSDVVCADMQQARAAAEACCTVGY